MKSSIERVLILSAAVAALGTGRAEGLINPNFTPVHLVRQSSLILELELGPAKDGRITATVKRVLKGKCDRKTASFVLSTSTFKGHVKTVEELIGPRGGTLGALFAGGLGEDQGGPGPMAMGPDPTGGDQPNTRNAFLHIAGTWVAFAEGKSGDWKMTQVSETMGTTWAGGTDMLIRATEYILADPDADVPVRERITWAGFEKFATLDGEVRSLTPVDLLGDGKWTLHFACDRGDRLVRYDAKTSTLTDVTAKAGLTAKSKLAAWGDFNADGRMDLLSSDGRGVVVHTQGADGTFQAGKKRLSGILTDDCLALACIDSGKAGRPAVVISTKASPLLWMPDVPDRVKPIGGAFAGADLGDAGPCLIADFDGDAIADILQLFEKGSLIYKGEAPGRFAKPRRCVVSIGSGRTGAFLGDFDADGLLDIFAVAADAATRLWSNRGRFEFADTMAMTGELAYKGGSGAVGGMTGDFNNDGRQDVLFYYAATSPRLYFNRGFRSFGLANGVDLSTHNVLPAAEEGAQAGCLADVNGDGAQDMILLLKNGQAWVFFSEAGEESVRCLRGALSGKGPHIGPMTVTGWDGGRCLGAWNVVAGTSEALLGRSQAGPLTLKWQAPGQKPQQKKVVLEDAPVRVTLP